MNLTALWIPGDWGNLLILLLTVWKKVELWGEFYGLKSVGVSENGLFLIEKPDGEVVEFSNDQVENDEYRQYLGSGLPKVYLGWTNNLSYKTGI